MTLGTATAVELALPLAAALVAAFAWDAWVRPVAPPRFQPYSIRPDWQVDPLAILDQDLRRGRLTVAIRVVHDRLLEALVEGGRVAPAEIGRYPARLGGPGQPPVERTCRLVRVMAATHRIAALAEDPRRTDLWSSWRRPAWRARAEQRFRAELAEAEMVWPELMGAT